jgi:hypothetical protein
MTTSHSMPEHDVIHQDDAVRETPGAGPGSGVSPAAGDDVAGDDLDVLILDPDQYTAEDAPRPAEQTMPDPIAEPAAQTMPAMPDPIAEPAAETMPDPIAEPAAETVPDPIAEPAEQTMPDPVAEPTSTIFEPATAIVEPPAALVEPPGTPPADAFAADIPPTNPDYRWREIQSMFVDDPRGSVERAAELAHDTLRDLTTTLRERERDLRSTWQNTNADTEELRTSLQSYRALADQISELARQR